MQNFNPKLIKARASYIPDEIAKTFGIDRDTVYKWLKKEKLEVIKKNTKPLLIMGEAIKKFIIERKRKGKIKLKDGEYFCCKCHKAKKPKPGSEHLKYTGKILDKIKQTKKMAICETCGTQLNRFLKVN